MKNVYVTCFGQLWRLTPGQWKRWLHLQAIGSQPSLGSVGGKVLGEVENVSDLTPEDAAREVSPLLTETQRVKLGEVEYDDDGQVVESRGQDYDSHPDGSP